MFKESDKYFNNNNLTPRLLTINHFIKPLKQKKKSFLRYSL